MLEVFIKARQRPEALAGHCRREKTNLELAIMANDLIRPRRCACPVSSPQDFSPPCYLRSPRELAFNMCRIILFCVNPVKFRYEFYYCSHCRLRCVFCNLKMIFGSIDILLFSVILNWSRKLSGVFLLNGFFFQRCVSVIDIVPVSLTTINSLWLLTVEIHTLSILTIFYL